MEAIDLNQEPPKRPTFLKVLCILTFVNTGISILTVLFSMIVTGPLSEEQMIEQKVELADGVSAMEELGADYWVEYMESAVRLSEEANDSFYLAMMVALFTSILGLFAALQMWKGAKLGFHLYIIYSLLGIVGAYIYASPANVHSLNIILGLIFSGIFVFMYSRNLKWMK